MYHSNIQQLLAFIFIPWTLLKIWEMGRWAHDMNAEREGKIAGDRKRRLSERRVTGWGNKRLRWRDGEMTYGRRADTDQEIRDVDTEEKSVIVRTVWRSYSILDMNEKASERHISAAITNGRKWKHSMSKLSLCTNQMSLGDQWMLLQCVGTSGHWPTSSVILRSPQPQNRVACCDLKSSLYPACARVWACTYMHRNDMLICVLWIGVKGGGGTY